MSTEGRLAQAPALRIAMAVTAAQLIDDPTLLAQAKVEFEQTTGDFTYKAAIPDGAAPPKPHI